MEDNEVNQLVAREMVTRLGYQAEVVADGSEAVSAVGSVSYAAVLMDCHMPVMDGFEATRTIRATGEATGHLPIIAMTAGAQNEDRERCRSAGMDDYLTKPVDLAALGETLARWIPRAALPPAPQPPAVDPERLAVLRGLGPSDGLGLLPAAAEAFRSDVPSSLEALRQAFNDGRDVALRQAAHKLKGAAANIGANGAALLCGELEQSGGRHGQDEPDGQQQRDGQELLVRLETDLARVDRALEHALSLEP